MIKGKIHSIQTLGTLDGPGVRFVVFMQGCNLRCQCCHNPDTWSMDGGTEYTPEQIVEKVKRYKEYFGKEGGITFSGGEPLLQCDFVRETFKLCHENGINTCIDTSGDLLNDNVMEMLKYCDRVLLDVKYTENDLYKKYVGCSLDTVIKFLEYLNKMNIPTTLRHVVIPTKNDYFENFQKLKAITEKYKCIDYVELLPFRKICTVKYDKMGIEFPFKDIPEPEYHDMEEYRKLFH
ncbi:MAG: pyruvate formate lyase-activating protein [Ruminococcaceae bacterium]|nr:pyruvate formate lyase-activating protein [Oscillospiraceae bacterium]